ncbi:MAG: hypothetical protein BWY77_01097 [bacterium ADurb.Bin431]|nr:MAG: hypothetical protein BWY77_01097 [bacterium ADurb.Bin431]
MILLHLEQVVMNIGLHLGRRHDADRDLVDILRPGVGHLQNHLQAEDRLPVLIAVMQLDPRKPLLLHGGQNLAVLDDSAACIVIIIETQNTHYSLLVTLLI